MDIQAERRFNGDENGGDWLMDFSQVKQLTIPEGEVTEIICNGVTLWKGGYTNQVPISTDTDGSIFNGVGYKENVRLSSSGGISSSEQNGSVTTGFIPWGGDTSVLRMAGVEWKDSTANHGGHYYINCYDANKKFLRYLSAQEAPGYTHVVTVTRDSSGIETVKFNEEYGTTNEMLNGFRTAKYIRINAYGKGTDMIVTINEEITL